MGLLHTSGGGRGGGIFWVTTEKMPDKKMGFIIELTGNLALSFNR